MTKEEILETLARVARDKVKGSQGVIILVVQDGPQGADATGGAVNIEGEQIGVCLRSFLQKIDSRKSNGLLIVPGRH